MNGIALLLVAATLGVEYDWQTTDDGQIEYVLIVEPDFLTSLAEGSEIRSSVPPELESVQRLCIRIAPPVKAGVAPQPPVPRKLAAESFRSSRIGLRAATEPTTIFWKAAGQPAENQLVRYGWQPTKEGLQEYFVQIDPKLLRTLQPGDEIYTQLAAEAGRTDTFVVFSNAKQLPKVAGRPAAPPLAGPAANPSFGPAPFNPPSTTPATFGPPAAAGNPPAFAPPRSFGVSDDPVLDPNSSRVNPATGYEPAPAPYNPPATGFTPPGAARPNLNNTGLNQPANPNENFRNDGYGANGLRNPPATNPPLTNDPYRRDLSPPMNPPRSDLFPAGGYNNTANTQPNNPPTNAPYRPAGNYPQDNQFVSNPPPQPGFNDPRMQPPAPSIDYRPASNDNQFASLPNNNSLRPGVNNDLKTTPLASAAPAEKPWWPFVFVAFGLFISIGANLYLGWTAAEFYSRYRLAVERLRTSGR
jgi:hypothetical protein